MQVVYAREAFPKNVVKSIFLAGPTPRSSFVPGWRTQALEILQGLGYDGQVFVPETSDHLWTSDYMGQVEWEEEGLRRADCIVFWVPRSLPNMPGFTTNDEWGYWKTSGKVVFGAPVDAEKIRYQAHYADKLKVPMADTLARTLMDAIEMVGDGAEREGGECDVPLAVWRFKPFQQWYSALQAAGNRLDGAEVHWTFRVGPKGNVPFLVALHADVHIAAEGRNKTNEFVLMRPDVSAVVMWAPKPWSSQIRDAKVVLVREFRTPVRNGAGYVYELPGGSAKDTTLDTLRVACEEIEEETGFKPDPARLRPHDDRQIAATTLSHHAALFSYHLMEEELAAIEADKAVHGVEADTERTYVDVRTIGEIVDQKLVDWSTLGMILRVTTT
jgi:8-oxo-dGTP pyrophosphatase MutT (NUDIX family)